MKNIPIALILALLICFSMSCSDKGSRSSKNSPTNNQSTPSAKNLPQFTSIGASSSGIDFANNIVETNDMYYYTFEYIYNGGGVAIGDINNDQLPDIYFTSTMANNKLYLNRGNFVFEDITDRAGVAASEGFKTGVSMIDINNDGYMDIFVCRTGKDALELRNNLLFINNGDLTFTERAAEYGLEDESNTNHANFFDYDNDGDLDLYLLNHPIDFGGNNRPRLKPVGSSYKRVTEPSTPNESDRLYRNNGDGTYTNVSKAAGIRNRAFGLSVTVSDFNDDGYADIYVGNDFIEPDYLYINNRDGTFTDELSSHFSHLSQHSMGADYADLNNDGHADLMVLDMLADDHIREKQLMTTMKLDKVSTLREYGYGKQLMRNVLQINNGNGTYSDIAWMTGTAGTDWSWGPLMADLDNDGLKDIFLTNGYKRDVTNLDFVAYRKQLGGSSKSVKVTDVHQILNLIPSTKMRNYIFHNKGNLNFEDVSDRWGLSQKTFSNGAAYADLDNDGDLDLVINNIDDPALVYRNNADQNSDRHFLRIKFRGPEQNINGIGTKATVYIGDEQQYQELRATRGFFSSVEQILHFGLGKDENIDLLTVQWPDGTVQSLEDLKADQLVEIDYNGDIPNKTQINNSEENIHPIFTEVAASKGINFKHRENDFVDFKREILLPHQLSRLGPFIASGDVNGDGLADFYVGGAAGQAGALFVQDQQSTFRRASQDTWNLDKSYEDMGVHFFDADNDQDLDLYVVSGGYAFDESDSKYQDRIYINNGKGIFKVAPNALPQMRTSGSCVASADYDDDGDLDLFVGGRAIPNKYPYPPRSYLLQNNNGRFTDVTAAVLPEMVNGGMITDVVFTDVNGDDVPDLFIAGEWLPVILYINVDGKFRNQTKQSGLEQYFGWWNCISAADIDNDGDLDLVAGNLGWNSRHKASMNEPTVMFAADFDNNGKVDPILCYAANGAIYPIAHRNEMLMQVPSLQKKYTQYQSYANATVGQIFPREALERSYKLKATTFSNAVFENIGQGTYQLRELPVEAQIAPVFGSAVQDFTGDGKPDILIAGNNYTTAIERGPYDAGHGLLLSNQDKRGFAPVPHQKSGFFVSKDTKDLVSLKLANGHTLILVANNNDVIQAFERKSKIVN